MSVSRSELYKAINSCLKPVKDNIAEVDKRVQSIMSQLDQIEVRVKNISSQLDTIEESVKEKVSRNG